MWSTLQAAIGDASGGQRAARSRALLKLAIALVVVSIALARLPHVPIAIFSPVLAIGVAAISGSIGLALLQLGIVRFGILGSRLDLFAGMAFGTLALANLGLRLLSRMLGALQPGVGLWLLLLIQMLAAILFMAGLCLNYAPVPAERRRLSALRVTIGVGLVLISVGIAALTFGGHVADLMDPGGRAMLAQQAPVYAFLPGQTLALVLADIALVLLYLGAALGYMRAAPRLGDAQLPTALLLLCFSHVHAVLFPPVDTAYVGWPDLFRLSAYLAVLFSLVGHLGAEIAVRSARDEQLRLSRELHDGLVQQLSLLKLRLSRATAPERSSEARARDLGAAQRLVEAALLEARQAIAVLRSGRISWQELVRAVETFADEFSANHDVMVEVHAEGDLPHIDAELRLDILRMLHEAFSNAIRHGRATVLSVTLAASPGGLAVTIRDNGHGFDPERALLSKGVGLDSMIERLQRRRGTFRIDAQPGEGATIHASLPVSGPRTAA